MDAVALAEIIRLHGTWLRDEAGGKRADLGGANLGGADLSGANLSGATGDGAERAIAARTRRVDMAWLESRGACAAGKRWVTETLGGTVSVADCYAAGKDDYAYWLYQRVMELIYAEAK